MLSPELQATGTVVVKVQTLRIANLRNFSKIPQVQFKFVVHLLDWHWSKSHIQWYRTDNQNNPYTFPQTATNNYIEMNKFKSPTAMAAGKKSQIICEEKQMQQFRPPQITSNKVIPTYENHIHVG